MSDGKNFRLFLIWLDSTLLFWFTVWLFWIHKPMWRWVFLALVLIDGWFTGERRNKMFPEEKI